MWLILGLFAALSATAVIDGMQSSETDANDESEDNGQDGTEQTESGHAAYQSLLHQFAGSDDMDSLQSTDMPSNPSDAGLFDNIGERIHSSDLFPPAQPPLPVFLDGTDGDDQLIGGVADDTLQGGAGNDTLIGAGGDNLLHAGSGDNHLIGGEGHDTLFGGTGHDTLEGGWGDDLLVSGGGDNLLMGGAGDDTLIGVQLDASGTDQSGANILNGGAGDDLLIAGQGDSLHGGEGADQFALGDWLAGQEPAVILDYSADADQIVLYYDASQIAAPDVTVSFDEADPSVAEIRLGGQVIAQVVNAPNLTADAVILMPGHPEQIAIAAE